MFNVDYEETTYDVYVRLRPHFRQFLERATEIFEVYLHTYKPIVYSGKMSACRLFCLQHLLRYMLRN